MTDLGTQLGRGRPRIQLMALSTLPHHGWYPQSRADLEFISLDGRRKTSSYLPTLSLFPGVQPEAASFPESVKDPVCWGKHLFCGMHRRPTVVRMPKPGTCGSTRGRQPLPLKQTCSLLSRGGSVQGEAMCVGRGALDPRRSN